MAGITQDTVDSAVPLELVLQDFESWLRQQGLLPAAGEIGEEAGARPTFAMATDGPWDIMHFLARESRRKKMDFVDTRPWLQSWVNLRWLHAEFYSTPLLGLKMMLKMQKMSFVGR